MIRRAFSWCAWAALALLSGCASERYFESAGAPPFPPPRYTLASLPQKDIWTGIVFNGAKVGFTHFRLEPAAQPGHYEVFSEAVMRFKFLALDKRVRMKALDRVDKDSRLESFDYDFLLDDSRERLRGEAKDGELVYELISGDRPPERRELRFTGALYPSSTLWLLPVLAGLQVGKEYRYQVFSGETQRIEEALQRVESWERSTLFDGPAFKVRTDMLGLGSTSWIDARGRPIFEIGLNGVMVSALEDERSAKDYLAAAAVNKDDVLVDWSLVRANLPIADPRKAEYLKIELTAPAGAVPPSDGRQRCRREKSAVVCEVRAEAAVNSGASTRDGLQSTQVVPSSDPIIRALARRITAERSSTPGKIAAVLDWLDRNIRKEALDAFSALDVLDAKRGECQGHAWLYAALMRSLGVPTRIANGLVYSSEFGGFLYHTWAESLVDGAWRAVDPTFDQPRADATHIALVYGETLDELAPLVAWVGNTRIRVIEVR